MNSPVNVIMVEGKNITRSAELPVQNNAAPVRIKATKGAKYLFTTGKDGEVTQPVIVRRSGKNLQVFLDNDDSQPELIIEDYYDRPGELAGMGSDGQYHTYISEGMDSDAFMLLADGAAEPLLLGSQQTVGLSGLSLAGAGAGLSTGWLIAGAVAGLLAVGGIAAAGGGGGGGGKGGAEELPPAPAPQPIDMNALSVTDNVGAYTGTIKPGDVTDDVRPVFAGAGTPGNTVRFYDNGQLVGSTVIDANGHWQWQPENNLAAGSHDFSFAEANRDGVESDRSEGIGFELDLTAPSRVTDFVITDDAGAVQGPVSPGDTFNDATPTFSGRAEPGAIVEIRDNGELIGSALVGADGSWSFTPETPLADGEHTFSAVVVDPAGNKGLPVSIGPVIIDAGMIDVPEFTLIHDGNGQSLLPGDATNASPLQLGGKGTPGHLVTIIDNGLPVGSVVIGENGEWSFELPLTDEGEHDIGFIVTGPGGTELGRSDEFSFDYDITAPEAPEMSNIVVADDEGNLLVPGAESNVTRPVFSGTAEEGDIVRLYDGDDLIGSALVGADGKWTIVAPELDEGDHSFRTEIEDRAGNVSEKSDSFDLIIDVTPPEAIADLSIVDDQGQPVSSGDALNTGDLTFSGSALEGETVYLWEGNDLLGSVLVGPGGQWSIPAEMSEEREYAFRTEVRDPAGNSSGKSEALDVTYDITAPVPADDTVIKNSGGEQLNPGDALKDGNVVFSGTAQEGEIVYLRDGNTLIGSVLVGSDGKWSIPAEMTEERNHQFNTEIRDAAGNSSGQSAPLDLVFDITAPDELSFGTVKDASDNPLMDGAHTNTKRPVFNGTGVHGDIVYLVDANDNVLGSALVDQNGSWSLQPENDLGDATLALRLIAEDPAGNRSQGTDSFDLTIDTTPPAAAKDVVLENNDPTLSGGADSVEANSLVIIMSNNVEVGSTLAAEDGSWSWKGSTLANGNYDFTVVVVDQANNRSVASESIDYQVNTQIWNLDNGQQGWKAAGAYLSDTGYTKWNKQFYAGTGDTYEGRFGGTVIYQSVDMVAGQTYTFSFHGQASNLSNVAQLGIGFDNVFSSYTALSTSAKVISATYTAVADGPVTISIANATKTAIGNDFSIDDLSLREAGPDYQGISSTEHEIDSFDLHQYSLLINEDVSIIDLSRLEHKEDEIHQIDLSGHGSNTLNISAADILALGQENLFMESDMKQMMINGDENDVVNLEAILGENGSLDSWNTLGQITVGGVVYDVYQDGNQQVELLIQQGMQINEH